MTRSVRAVALYRPAWEAEGRRVAGPDEDAFTMAVAALESLGPAAEATSLGRLRTLGPLAPASAPGFAEALGVPTLETQALDPGGDAVDAVVEAEAHSSGDSSSDVVLAVETDSGTSEGAFAIAWLVGEGPGLRVERATGSAANGPVAAPIPRPSLEPGQPPGAAAVGRRESRGLDASVTPAVAALALARGARALGADRQATWSAPSGGGWTFRLSGPVRWVGDWETPGPGLPMAAERARRLRDPIPLDRVSEGAYLPRPRYLESLPGRWRLVAERCARCGVRTFPPRGLCRGCGSRADLRPDPLSLDDGLVEAVTTVRAGAQPTEFDPQVERFGDYDVAIVRLAPDVRATFQVADAPPGTLRVGDRVRTALRRLYPQEGEWRYGRKAVPKEPPRSSTPRS